MIAGAVHYFLIAYLHASLWARDTVNIPEIRPCRPRHSHSLSARRVPVTELNLLTRLTFNPRNPVK